MNYKQYRVGPGHYAIGDFTIYGCYPRWQVRDRVHAYSKTSHYYAKRSSTHGRSRRPKP